MLVQHLIGHEECLVTQLGETVILLRSVVVLRFKGISHIFFISWLCYIYIKYISQANQLIHSYITLGS